MDEFDKQRFQEARENAAMKYLIDCVFNGVNPSEGIHLLPEGLRDSSFGKMIVRDAEHLVDSIKGLE